MFKPLKTKGKNWRVNTKNHYERYLMKILLLICFILFFTACNKSESSTILNPHLPDTVSIDTVFFGNPNLLLKGVVMKRTNTTLKSAIIIINGSGSLDMDGIVIPYYAVPFYKTWAESLASNNFIVLRYNKRFLNHPEINPFAITESTQIEDVLSALTFLRTYPGVDTSRIYLIGHSEGGNIAPVAANISQKIHGLVLISTVGFSIDSLAVEQLRRNPYNTPAILQACADTFHIIRTNSTPPNFLNASGIYWKEWMHYSNKADSILLSSHLPTLVLQGLKDENFPYTTLDKNIERWQSISSQSPQLITFTTYPNATHRLFDYPTEHCSDIFYQDIISWLKNY
jgi:pimeloyl-ACP methyl ester carboxylesterase